MVDHFVSLHLQVNQLLFLSGVDILISYQKNIQLILMEN